MATLVQGSPEDRGFERHVESNADVVQALPRGSFTREAVSGELAAHLDHLRSKGILARTGTETRDADAGGSDYEIAVFELTDAAIKIADRVTETRDAICPCGHAGLRNCGDYYECQAAFCAREFKRSDLEADA
jgi:hypothetical protein